MTEYKLSLEHFLATTRRHFFAGEQGETNTRGPLEATSPDNPGDDE